MKSSLLLVLTVGLGAPALAQKSFSLPIRTSSEIEISCRTKAKEAAAQVYSGCVTDTKNVQIEMIKKAYQAKLLALKAHYEAELKKMGLPKDGSKTEKAAEDLKIEDEGNARLESEVISDPAMASSKDANLNNEKLNSNANVDVPASSDKNGEVLKTETAAEQRTEAAAEQNTETTALPKTETAAAPGTAAVLEAESDSQADLKTEVQSQSQLPTEAQAESQIQMEKKAGFKAKSPVKEQADSKVESEDLLNPTVTLKPLKKSPSKPALRPTLKPAVKGAAKLAVKAPVKPAAKARKKVVVNKKSIPAALKAPTKKSAAAASKKKQNKNSMRGFMPKEMTIRLRPAPLTPLRDESTMDLPEPIPVENVSLKSSL